MMVAVFGMGNEGGGNAPVYIRLADDNVYGTPPALAVSDVSGMYDLDLMLPNSDGTRWEKNVYSLVHDTGNDNLAIARFRPNGAQSSRTGTLTGSAVTITGSSPGAVSKGSAGAPNGSGTPSMLLMTRG